MSIQFDLPIEQSSIIKVIGVGGGGGNAVNHMFRQGIVGVNFVIANTDKQALDLSPIPNKIQLGASLTEGRGAGMNPEVGKKSAIESADQIGGYLDMNTKMLFITAGMGKGTGTGAAPAIAKMAREKNILTVGLVTTPFSAEGPRRFQQAQDGICEMRNYVDCLIVISNDKMRDMYGNQTIGAAFAHADNILANAAKSIAEIITVPGYVNVDFEDVKTVMQNSGVAIMGTANFSGENRAINAAEAALSSPLLNDNEIRGAKNILINISFDAAEPTLDELSDIQEYIQREAGYNTNIIWGTSRNNTLQENISVTVIATGFDHNEYTRKDIQQNSRVKLKLDESRAAEKKTRPAKHEEQEIPFEFEVRENETIPQQPENNVEAKTDQLNTFDLDPVSNGDPVSGDAQDETGFSIHEKPPVHASQVNKQDLPLSENARHDRVSKLKSLSMKINNPNAMNELENTPAYVRKGIQLKDVPPSDEATLSQFYVEPNDDPQKLPQLKKNNAFLRDQDKVD